MTLESNNEWHFIVKGHQTTLNASAGSCYGEGFLLAGLKASSML